MEGARSKDTHHQHSRTGTAHLRYSETFNPDFHEDSRVLPVRQLLNGQECERETTTRRESFYPQDPTETLNQASFSHAIIHAMVPPISMSKPCVKRQPKSSFILLSMEPGTPTKLIPQGVECNYLSQHHPRLPLSSYKACSPQ